jgi:outer membrane scaffolding protein for murein synthesis (MipA/OmpV family)
MRWIVIDRRSRTSRSDAERHPDLRRAAIRGLSCLPFILGLATASRAADLGAQSLPPPAPASTEGWIITLKGNVALSTDWVGAKSYGFEGYPSFSFRRADKPATWDAPDDGFGLAVYDTPNFSIGPVIRYDSGRYRADAQKLFGIRDVRWTVEPGGYVEFWPVPDVFRAHVELRHGLDSNDGFVADAALDYLMHFGPTTFALGPRLELGDQSFMRRDFQVTPIEAFQNGIVTAFKPGGGLVSAGLASSVTYEISKTWSTTVYGGYDRLVGDAAKSPLVRKLGSPDQFKAGLTVSYSFGFSGF